MSRSIAVGLGLLLSMAAATPAWADPKRDLSIAPAGRTPAVPVIVPTAAPAPEPRPQSSVSPASSSTITPVPAAAVEAPRQPAVLPPPVRVSSDPHPTYGPDTFVATMRAAEQYRALAESGGWPTITSGADLKPGGRGPMVPVLRRRLALTGDLAVDAPEGDTFDPALADALRRFQDRHGLAQTGSVGARTLAALNVPADVRARQLSASAGRLIGATFAFGERYVAVNIPSATVEAVEHGVVVRRYVAVVGKPDRPSPTIATRITNVNFNPTWTVPVSLIRRDIIPHMRKDPGFLARMKIKLLDGQGQEVDPAKVNWATEQAVNYTIRQDPGSANSLGDVRIDMPNRLAVYMHDTPAKRLFARDLRFESSGCVRVAGVHDLVAWLLDTTPVPPPPGASAAPGPVVAGPAFTPADVEAGIASGRRQDVKLAHPVPVAWIYLTGYATTDGVVRFRDDPYRMDEPASATTTASPLTIDALVTGSVAPR